MAAFELSFSFIMLLNFHHSSHHTGRTSMLSPVCLQEREILNYYVRVNPLLQKRQVQDKFSLVPTYLCSIATETSPCLDWVPADEKQQLNHVAFYDFSSLNMTLSGRKMSRKLYEQTILYTLHERRKAKKIGHQIKLCLCSFYINYTLTDVNRNSELIKNMLYIERKSSPCQKTTIQGYTNRVPQCGTTCFKVTQHRALPPGLWFWWKLARCCYFQQGHISLAYMSSDWKNSCELVCK